MAKKKKKITPGKLVKALGTFAPMPKPKKSR